MTHVHNLATFCEATLSQMAAKRDHVRKERDAR